MILAALSPDWQITALFFAFVLALCFVMKFVALRGQPAFTRWKRICSPFPTPTAMKRALPLSAIPQLIRRFLIALAVCAGAYWLYWNVLVEQGMPTMVWSYAGAIILWLVTEALGTLATFVALPTGRLLPLPHGASPPLAKSLSDFWGRRWNTWTSDWFRQIIFLRFKTRPVFALMLVFFVSGLAHELVINLPLYIVARRNCFGTMMMFFMLQAIGILIERRVRNRVVRVLFVWLFVFGASPLMINEGTLRILHLWPE